MCSLTSEFENKTATLGRVQEKDREKVSINAGGGLGSGMACRLGRPFCFVGFRWVEA